MGDGGTTLHVARLHELDPCTFHDIVRLRTDVFVVEQQCAYPELDGRDADPGTRHVWLTDGPDGSDLLSYLRILQPVGGQAQIGRIVTRPDRRKDGVASNLVDIALGMLDDELVPEVGLNAQLYAAAWYEGFGFGTCGSPFVSSGISHVSMVRPRPRAS